MDVRIGLPAVAVALAIGLTGSPVAIAQAQSSAQDAGQHMSTLPDASAVPLAVSDELRQWRTDKPPKLVIEAPARTARIIDGDTFWLSIFKIRLKGIDTVESRQSCRLGGDVQCAEQVRRELARLLGTGTIRCEVQFANDGLPAMHSNRYLATCSAAETEINLAMVEQGWAFADEKGTVESYVSAQVRAEAARIGVHGYAHEKPWDFRRRMRMRETTETKEAVPLAHLQAGSNMCRTLCGQSPPSPAPAA